MEYRFFEEGTVPECTTPEWYAERETAPHVDQAMHRPRLDMAAAWANELYDTGNIESVVDVGCGDGGFLSLLNPSIRAWGYDLQQTNIDVAIEVRHVTAFLRDAVNGDVVWGDLAVCTEMLEHLLDPHGFVAKIGEHCDFIIASSPWNETPEAHYGYHLWGWDMMGYADLIRSAGFHVTRHEATGMFQVLLGVK